MARRTHEGQYPTQEEGVSVSISLQAMGGVKAGQLGIKLGKMFGPSLGALIMGAHNKDANAMAGSVRELFGNLTETQFTDLLKSVLAESQIQVGDELLDCTVERLDRTFEGCPGSVYRVLFDGLRLNFQGFTKELGIPADLLAKLTTLGKKAADKAMKLPSA